MYRLAKLLAFALATSLVAADTVITYPGWRGNNLMSSGLTAGQDPSSVGLSVNNGSIQYPYGMQHTYPCGGLAQGTNRTKWPLQGGALAFRPGIAAGYKSAFYYINLGVQEMDQRSPPNISMRMAGPFAVEGFSDQPYNGSVCLLSVPLPTGFTATLGQNATIQLVQVASDGSTAYNCVDIEFADPKNVDLVTPSNCFNTSGMGIQLVFTSASLSAANSVLPSPPTAFAIIALALATFLLL